MQFKEFIDRVDESKAANIYAGLLLDSTAPNLAKQDFLNLFGELRDYTLKRFPENAEKDTAHESEAIIFAVVLSGGQDRDLMDIVADVAMIRRECLKDIPMYLKTHSYYDEDVLEEDHDLLTLIAQDESLSTPLLLTPLNEILDFSVYIPSEEPVYPSILAATLIYELSLFGKTLKESEEVKQEMLNKFSEGANIPNDANIDELMMSMKEVPSFETEEARTSFGRTLLMRHNARMDIYDRIYCDHMSKHE